MEPSFKRVSPPAVFRNWLSLAGLTVVGGSLFSFLLLFVLDAAAHLANSYVGVLTCLVAPCSLTFGLTLTGVRALWTRHRLKTAAHPPPLQIDLARPRDRRVLGAFTAGSVVFLLVSAVGSYRTYEFTKSVQF